MYDLMAQRGAMGQTSQPEFDEQKRTKQPAAPGGYNAQSGANAGAQGPFGGVVPGSPQAQAIMAQRRQAVPQVMPAARPVVPPPPQIGPWAGGYGSAVAGGPVTPTQPNAGPLMASSGVGLPSQFGAVGESLGNRVLGDLNGTSDQLAAREALVNQLRQTNRENTWADTQSQINQGQERFAGLPAGSRMRYESDLNQQAQRGLQEKDLELQKYLLGEERGITQQQVTNAQGFYNQASDPYQAFLKLQQSGRALDIDYQRLQNDKAYRDEQLRLAEDKQDTDLLSLILNVGQVAAKATGLYGLGVPTLKF